MPAGFPSLDFHEFHRRDLPERLARGHGALAAPAAQPLGSLAFRLGDGGSYTYVPPDAGDLRENATETFTYTVVDGDGDSDTATLTIDVENVIEPVGALLLTNTNVQDQDLRILITRDDGEIIANELTVRTGTGQESAIELGNGNGDVVFETSFDYAVILKFEGGAGTTNVTDFDLIFDLLAADLDDPDNVFLTLLDQGTIQLGDQGSGADGVIWQISGDPDDLDGDGEVFEVSPAILYDVEPDTALGDAVIFDSDRSNTSFELDFGLLPTGGDALFADIEVLDITGSQSDEVNTLTLNAQDVLDVTDPDDMLVVLGDNDTLVLADEGDLRFEASGTGQTLDGSSETFDIYNVVLDGVTVGTVFVDDDLTVQFETAMARSGRVAGGNFGMRRAGPWGRHWFFCLYSQPRRGVLRFSPARFVWPVRD